MTRYQMNVEPKHILLKNPSNDYCSNLRSRSRNAFFLRAKTQDTHLRPMASYVGRHHEANAPPICPWVLVQTSNYRRITNKHKHHFFHVHVFEQDILFGRVETQQFCMPHSFIVSFKSHTLSAVVRHAKPIALEQ
jgi:hypothetical protein